MSDARTGTRNTSYQRLRQRAEIAEAEERRLAFLLETARIALLAKEGLLREEIKNLRMIGDFKDARCAKHCSWRHDFGSVVGGVLLAAGLIAAFVWGVWG